jgi:hypothetical protein
MMPLTHLFQTYELETLSQSATSVTPIMFKFDVALHQHISQDIFIHFTIHKRGWTRNREYSEHEPYRG